MAKEIKKPDSATGEVLAQGIRAESKQKGKQAKADAAEKKRRAETMQTQGRAGCKLERLNCSLTPENFKFVRMMSRAEGLTMTKYVNEVLTEYREYTESNPTDLYKKAVEFFNMVDGVEVDE